MAMTSASKLRYPVWIQIFVCNLLWALNPSLVKIIIADIGAEQAAWLKYSSALCTYLIFKVVLYFARTEPSNREFFIMPKSPKEFFLIFGIGFCTCFISPVMQMNGLTNSSATNNAILVSFEPIFTFLLAWLLIGEDLGARRVTSLGVAIAGFFLLSKAQPAIGGSFSWAPLRGDALILVATAGEAFYLIFSKPLMRTHPATQIFGSAMLIGVGLLSVVLLPKVGLPNFGNLSRNSWLAVIWFGPIGTVVPYLLWIRILEKGMPLSAMSISLFLQPLIGVLSGIFLLNESLTFSQSIGAALIIGAVSLQTSRACPKSV